MSGASSSAGVDFKLLASAQLKTYPEAKEISAPTLWCERPALFYVARRLG